MATIFTGLGEGRMNIIVSAFFLEEKDRKIIFIALSDISEAPNELLDENFLILKEKI
jgi:hypothetical protein